TTTSYPGAATQPALQRGSDLGSPITTAFDIPGGSGNGASDFGTLANLASYLNPISSASAGELLGGTSVASQGWDGGIWRNGTSGIDFAQFAWLGQFGDGNGSGVGVLTGGVSPWLALGVWPTMAPGVPQIDLSAIN